MIISRLGLKPDALRGETVVVTGAGGGIGFEAARALLWLGANVVVAEIDPRGVEESGRALEEEFGADRVLSVIADIGDEDGVEKLREASVGRFGKVDAVINNATIAVLGLVAELPIAAWDRSYRVNLRGPVLMARAFLPAMIERDHGAFACVSSTGTAFLGAYEAFKAAQVHLANTLDAELEGKGVFAYAIGPGLVPTKTAMDAVRTLAPRMGMSVDEFLEMNKGAMLSVEEAGAGFAASVAFAERFRGQEISSIQALKAADIGFGPREAVGAAAELDAAARARALSLCEAARSTLREQAAGWKARSLFERQWVVRDFRKSAGMSAEEWLSSLEALEGALRGGGAISRPPLERLAGYYGHLAELAKGYIKDAATLEENLAHVNGWRAEVEALAKLL